MFESICNIDLMKILLENDLNLILKDNLLSLQNLIDINKGILKEKLKKIKEITIKHFLICENCKKHKSFCSICNDQNAMFFFEIKKTKVCERCKRVFHMKCYMERGCQECGVMALLGQINSGV